MATSYEALYEQHIETLDNEDGEQKHLSVHAWKNDFAPHHEIVICTEDRDGGYNNTSLSRIQAHALIDALHLALAKF